MGIKSVELSKGNKTRRVQVGSKAFNRYTNQGYSLVSGSGRNLNRRETREIFGGGGSSNPSSKLKDLSIALANQTALPEGVKADVFDRNTGRRTGQTVDVGGRIVTGNIYSDELDRSGNLLNAANVRAAEAEAAAAEAQAGETAAKAKGSLNTTLVGGQSLAPAGDNPFAAASATFTKPTFDDQRFAGNQDFFNKMFDPGATANTTPMFGPGIDPNAGFAGGGAGGGGGFSWGGGGGQYTPGITADGTALTATRNLGVPGGTEPTPTSKPQANVAGVPDTGGQAAANQGSGDSLLKKTMLQLVDALTAQRDLLQQQLTGTADPVDEAVANMDDALTQAYNSALADLPDYEKMKQDAKDLYELKADLIEDRRDELEDRFDEDRDSIEADFDQQEDDLEQSQKEQTGRLRGGLASAGAYLGFDNVNHSAMLSLQVTHDREMTVLGQAKISALIEARRAFQDADFALVTEHVNAIEAYDNKITELANTHFSQTLQLTQEARDNVRFMQETETFNRAKSFDNLDAVIQAGTMPTDTDINNYARQLSLSPEDVRGYISEGIRSKQLEEKQQKSENELSFLRLLTSLDNTQSIVNPFDGQTYRGLNVPAKSGSSSSDALTFEEVFEDFNNSPLARQFAEMNASKETAYQLFTTTDYEQLPAELQEEIRLSVPDLSGNEAEDADRLQRTWDNMRGDALGPTSGGQLGQFTSANQQKIVAEINQQIEEGTLQDFDGQQSLGDIAGNPNYFDYATLATFLRQANERGGTENAAEELIRLLNEES